MRAKLIIQFVGYKNTGKTTWVCRMTEAFKQAGYKVGTVKHDAHDFQMDKPGTDTWKHQEAGADVTAISSSERTAIIKRRPDPLDSLIASIERDVDIILVEGFKTAPYPKIVCAKEVGHLRLLETTTRPLALVCWPDLWTDQDALSSLDHALPKFAYDDYASVFRLMQSLIDAPELG
ncbi:molybdopterin-guanine dinucleotide biosynthesis protein B [Paenibacillus soyae]|uniref:Molybdopterin-guanine dinucleotide biosynthesis protein B n=1 Tax=Paenibacillus soyae TaxID=2969249 RepID=A0A9X2MKE4_9BACL|nr:molybdopterin-guanine dinucleotide biosynthesis protein B [Paenibacillus soyae]MCR2802271.1 molybdopterin-guanine dinucleotide biosynthesis protein B [Paenibacillus soyae]